MSRALARVATLALAWAWLACGSLRAAPAGRWDLAVEGESARYAGWLEIAPREGGAAVRYVGRVGSVRTIKKYELREHDLAFAHNEWFGAYELLQHAFHFEGDRLTGEFRRPNGQALRVTGRRAPDLVRPPAAAWTAPRPLFNGHDLGGWTSAGGIDPAKSWRVRDGELTTFTGGAGLRTTDVFDDFRLHAEFNHPAGSNSGIHLRGRYEFQIEDDSPNAPPQNQTGGLYGWLAPRQPVPRRPDTWHTLDITLVGRRVTAVLDGVTLYANAEIPGVTGNALDSDEAAPGPIVLQASHSKSRGAVRFRHLTIATPAGGPTRAP